MYQQPHRPRFADAQGGQDGFRGGGRGRGRGMGMGGRGQGPLRPSHQGHGFGNAPAPPGRFRSAQHNHNHTHGVERRFQDRNINRLPIPKLPVSPFPRAPILHQLQFGHPIDRPNMGYRNQLGYGPPTNLARHQYDKAVQDRIQRSINLRNTAREHKATERHPTASNFAQEHVVVRSYNRVPQRHKQRMVRRPRSPNAHGDTTANEGGDEGESVGDDGSRSWDGGRQGRERTFSVTSRSTNQENMSIPHLSNGGVEIVNLDRHYGQTSNGTTLGFNGLRAQKQKQEAQSESSPDSDDDNGRTRVNGRTGDTEVEDEDGDFAKGDLAEIEALDSLPTQEIDRLISKQRLSDESSSSTAVGTVENKIKGLLVRKPDLAPVEDEGSISRTESGVQMPGSEAETPITETETRSDFGSSARWESELDFQESRRTNPYRFTPDSFAIGVLDGEGNFTPGFHSAVVESSVAFDPRKKAFLFDLIPVTPEPVPMAMELVDALLRLEDIVEQGINISATRVDNPYGQAGGADDALEDIFDVTMTITCRRPPQFFMPVMDKWNKPVYKDLQSVEEIRAEHDRIAEKVLRPGVRSNGGQYNRPETAMQRKIEGVADDLRKMGWHGVNRESTDQYYAGRKAAAMGRAVPKGQRYGAREERIEDIGYGKVQKRRATKGAVIRWRRATEFDFSGSFNGTEKDAGPIGPDGDIRYKASQCDLHRNISILILYQPVQINFWTTYRFTYYLTAREYRLLQGCMRRLRMIGEQDEEVYLSPIVASRLKTPQNSSHPPRDGQATEERMLQPVVISEIIPLQKLPFFTRFLIEGLVSQAIIQSYQVREVAMTVTELSRDSNPKLIDQVLGSLFTLDRVADIHRTIRKRFAIYGKINTLMRPKSQTKGGGSTIMMRRAIITPTRMLLYPEEKEQSNSVLDHYSEYRDRFLRVQFNDEHDQLQVNASVKEADAINPDTGTMARVRRALMHGLEIGGRKYLFLAASASQSKEHSCWFFAEVGKQEAGGKPLRIADILEWMGNLTKEQVVAKHAARQGLRFSTTQLVSVKIKLRRPMEDIVVREVPDDLTSKVKYCFTDGVGRCAQDVVDQAAKDMGFEDEVNAHPSAIQFRLGGAKGVLLAWPTLKPREVFLRKSQIKFESETRELRVVRISQYRKAFLNRQFIILMASLGVNEDLFKHLIWDKAKSIIGLPDRVRRRKLSTKDLWMIDKVATFPMAALINAGFHKDPVLLDCCAVIERRLLSELRWHARVEIDKGVYAIGVADETGLLKEGEVFCQYHDPNSEEGPVVITGPCIVTRAPTLHPGDVRRVVAVDIPELRSVKNVIVFNVKGDRDLPNMLGGGDLDGDDFTLIWDERFVKDLVEAAPGDYTAMEPKKLPWVEHDDIKENFVNHILNDLLGLIGNAHLAYCDLEGPFSENCLKLCQLYSTAVDFTKTGIPAELPMRYRPSLWPDFMGKEAFRSYDGQSILGKLYRMVTTKEPKGVFIAKNAETLDQSAVDTRLKEIEVPLPVMQLAAKLKVKYDLAINAILIRYKLTEIELVTGLVLKNGKRKRIRDGDLKDPIRDAYRDIINDTLELAIHGLLELQITSNLGPHPLFALAAYKVTYEPQWRQIEPGLDLLDDELPETKMLSFAWVAWKDILSLPVFEQPVPLIP